MERMYKKIVETIELNKQKFINAGVHFPETVDVFLGQPDNPELFEFFTPAIFVDYSADYDGELLYIYIHALQDFGKDSENFTNSNEGLNYFKFLTVLKRCLNGIKIPPIFGVLKLHEEVPIVSEFNYHQITFKCNLYMDLDLIEEPFQEIVLEKVSINHGKLKEKRSPQ